MKLISRMFVGIVAAALVASAAAPAMACPVCYGASDEPMAAGMNNGIFFLLGVIGMVQIGFVALFVSFRRRGKAYQERRDSLAVIEGGLQ